jgi:hypothetical protein
VADKLAEGPRPLPFAVTANPRNRQLGVVVEDRQRHAAEEGERTDVPIQERLGRLRRKRLHERSIRVRKIHEIHMELLAHATNHTNRDIIKKSGIQVKFIVAPI